VHVALRLTFIGIGVKFSVLTEEKENVGAGNKVIPIPLIFDECHTNCPSTFPAFDNTAPVQSLFF